MTADMGDAFLAALGADQRALVAGLVDSQRTDLYEIVAKRGEIADRLRALLSATGTVDDAAVLTLAREYGEVSYLYAMAFSAVAQSLTGAQKATLIALRKTATAQTSTGADYDLTCGNGFLYSAPLQSAPAVMDTDFLFGVCGAAGQGCGSGWDCCSFSCAGGACTAPFALASPAFADGGRLPQVYTCDGASSSPPLAWSGAPSGTVQYALTLTTPTAVGTRYNWVLYGIPASVAAVATSTSVGTPGASTDGPELRYYAPCRAARRSSTATCASWPRPTPT
jgi:hypothetical protein